MRRWMTAPVFFAAALGVASWADAPAARAQPKGTPPTEETIRTADGMKLKGLFHASKKPKGGKVSSAPVVLFLYPPGQDRSMTKGDWESLANTLNDEGFHVFRFDWRFHGKSFDVDNPLGDNMNPGFWNNPISGPTNAKYIKGSNAKPAKNIVKVNEVDAKYFPMYVQDLAAVRMHLDQKSDQGELNSSTIYVVGSEEAATLGLFWMTTEWQRPGIHPLLGGGQMYKVVPTPGIVVDPEAGKDIAGAVWLSAARPNLVSVPVATIQAWVKNTPKMRDLNPMLFLYGEGDAQGKSAAKFMYEDVLVAEGNKSLNVKKLEQTFLRDVKGTKLRGVGLLDPNLKPATADTIVKYLHQLEKERGNIVPKARSYSSPYYINTAAFGVFP